MRAVAEAPDAIQAWKFVCPPAVMNTSPSVSTAIASYPGKRPSHATAGLPIATAAVANASASMMSGPATEKTDHVSDGDPVNGFRISPRRSELPEVATQKLWPVTTATRLPAAVPVDTPTRHGS